ncbi:Hypothetical protein2 [Nesidiocoris tenuis]|uniref:Endonuclease n=1 Tax=Nesidiocoris tenuis TaxID=355587 RepID=A0ABN7AG53_9HEMI|nr:Hypothetical protein2 [Nesidiocoris tenuis]
MVDTKDGYPQLGSSNYANWKFRVLLLLEEKKVKNVLTPLPASASEAEKTTFREKDVSARSLVIKCIPDRYIDIVMEASSAAEMLVALGKVFERKSTMSKLMIRKRLLTLKCDTDLQTHFAKFDSLVRELETMGTKMDQDDKICHLLLTLPSAFDNVITVLETMDSADLSIDFVKNKLLDVEIKWKQLHPTDKNIEDDCAFYSRSGNKCWECGDNRHFRENCPKIGRASTSGSLGRVRADRGRGSARRNYRRNYWNRANMADEETNRNDECKESGEISFVTQAVALDSVSECEKDGGQGHREIVRLIIDSGSTDHLVMESVLPLMENVRELHEKVLIKVANGQKLTATRKGTLRFQGEVGIVRLDALVVPQLSHNLLSVRKINKRGFDVIFSDNRAFVKDKNGVIHVKCDAFGNLFAAELRVVSKFCGSVTTNAIRNSWHLKLGHLCDQYLRQMNLPVCEDICNSCREAKSTRLPFRPTKKPRSNRIGHLLHTDICGPMKTPTMDGHKYFMVVVDDYSHFVTVFLLTSRTEAETNLRSYIARLRADRGIYTSRIRLDNAAEFRSNSFKKFCRTRGIKLEFSVPHSPQMNGVSENIQKTLVTKARCMFADTNLPRHLWGECIRTAAYQLNRCPSTAIGGRLPAEIYLGKTNLERLRIFGSRVWAHKLPKVADKMDPRAVPARMVGYNENGYRLYNPVTNDIFISRDVVFDESDYRYEPVIVKYHTPEKESVPVTPPLPDQTPAIDDRNQPAGTSVNEQPTVERRQTKTPKKYNDYELYTTESYVAYCLLTGPKTFKEAIDDVGWREAIDKELNALENFKTWRESDTLPIGQKAIQTRWVFREKSDGTKRARLVVKGFQENTDLESYSPVARMSTVRMLLAKAANENLPMTHLDVPTAFLHGELDHEVYIEPPEGTKYKNVLRLQKALYGLKTSPRCWNKMFHSFMTERGFTRSPSDSCLYRQGNVWLVLWVDDSLIVGKDCSGIIRAWVSRKIC